MEKEDDVSHTLERNPLSHLFRYLCLCLSNCNNKNINILQKCRTEFVSEDVPHVSVTQRPLAAEM